MINIKQLSQRYKIYDYNIGLIKATPTDVIFGNFDLCSVHWLKHKYRDRMFADPLFERDGRHIGNSCRGSTISWGSGNFGKTDCLY